MKRRIDILALAPMYLLAPGPPAGMADTEPVLVVERPGCTEVLAFGREILNPN